MGQFLKQMGFDGVNDFPTVGVIDGNFRLVLEEAGIGFYKGGEMFGTTREMDLFTIVYGFNPTQAVEMVRAGADVSIAHMGTTTGGTIGAKIATDLQDAVKQAQGIYVAAFSVSPNVICMSYGGLIATAKEAAHINRNTSTVGFVDASSVPKVTTSFNAIPVN